MTARRARNNATQFDVVLPDRATARRARIAEQCSIWLTGPSDGETGQNDITKFGVAARRAKITQRSLMWFTGPSDGATGRTTAKRMDLLDSVARTSCNKTFALTRIAFRCTIGLIR